MRKIIIATMAALIIAVTAPAITIHTIGDSTMSTYDESTSEKRGWGQMLSQFFSGLTVNNKAKSGASSKSFYQESSYWPTAKKSISEGDYVVIQFAHNDEKANGCDGDSLKAYYTSIGDTESASNTDYRGTSPFDTYKTILSTYIEEVRELGATPILASPICRRYFSSGDITRTGRHDLGGSFYLLEDGVLTTGNSVSEDDDTYDYPAQMKAVAEELDVPFIDLTTATADLYISYGSSQTQELLFVTDDNTHTNAMGATLVARLFTQLLQQQDILTDYINLTSELGVSSDTCDLGEAYSGQTITKELQVTGFDLSSTSGTVTISATGDVLLSADGEEYAQSIDIAYSGGNIIETFYIQYTMDEAGEINETITVECGDVSITIAVVGTCIALADGDYVCAYWRLESDSLCATEGDIESAGETYADMKLQRYSAPNSATTWPEWTGYEASRKTQRNVIESEVWPAGEEDEVSTRWIDFAAVCPEGKTLSISSISLFCCGCGGNGMCCKIYYFVNDALADAVMMASYTKMVANNMEYVSATPVLSLEEGDTLHIRFYPWYNGTANGKTLCISDVTIEGVSNDVDATGIREVNTSAGEVVSTAYYTLDGMQIAEPRQGVVIIRETYADGTVRTKKVRTL